MSLGTEFETTLMAARTGAEWSWRRLYEELAPTVLRYLRSRGAPDPEDLTAEVFLQVVRQLHQFEGEEGPFRAWVMTIARHRYIDALRSRSRRPVDPVVDEVLTLAGSAGDVEREALESLATEDIRIAMSKLAPDQRDILLLRILAGLSIAEVAAATDRSQGAVKSLQARGVKALRRNMAPSISQPEAVSR